VTDEVTLVVPAEEDFHPVVHLVVGGLAAKLDLTMDALADLQIAHDALLAQRSDDEDIEVRVVIDGGVLHTTVGPFPAGIADELERDSGELGLGRVLETVCAAVDVEVLDGDVWLELTHAGG
jgi:hypothetical protein